tara:strand:- start:277 stop:441 length:165 start_codon:yes stop_codon:yes gene_type:complete
MNFDISSPVWIVLMVVFLIIFIGSVWWASTHGVDYKSTPKNEKERHEFFDDYSN